MQLQLLNIEPISTGGDCIEDLLVTICAWFNRRYEMMYIHSLYFDYQVNDPALTVGERIKTQISDEFQVHLEQYHGLKFQFQMNHTIDQDLDLIEKQLQEGNPVIIIMDSYYIPWDPKYHLVHHLGHVFLAVGIDSDLKAIYGTDPFFQKITQKISYKDLILGYEGCIAVKAVDEEVNDIEAIVLDITNHILEGLHSDHRLKAMEAFGNELRMIDFEKELEGIADFGGSAIFVNLGKIVRWRINYANLLQSLEEHYSTGHFKTVIDQLKHCSFLWAAVRGCIAKAYFSTDLSMRETMLQNAFTKITDIAELEKQLSLQLLMLLKHKENGEHKEVLETRLPNKSIALNTALFELEFLQLQALFNNRGFENKLNTADLDLQGYYFTSGARPKENPTVVNEMSFYLAKAEDNGFDNIACYGHTIELEPAHYHNLMILGCSEMGSFLEKISIEYEGHDIEKLDFGFSDWWVKKAMENETIALKGQIGQKDYGPLPNEVNLYARCLELNPHKKAVKLILPLMPNIHIFAISLLKLRKLHDE